MPWCCCWNRYKCTSGRKQELRVFDFADSEPLIRSTNPYTVDSIVTVLYQMLVNEFTRPHKNCNRQTHVLGTEQNDSTHFTCIFCNKHAETTYVQYDINNSYF